MIFRQLFDYDTWTYTYILADEDTKKAIIIDAVKEQFDRDVQVLSDLGLTLEYILETHAHADHIAGARQLREKFTDAQIGYSKNAGLTCPDQLLDDGDTIEVGDVKLQVLLTPGHTNGCVSFYDGKNIYTGDALLIRGTGRTDFQAGDAGTLYDSIMEKIFTLPGETFIYPAHDYNGHTVSTITEEKTYNPRLANKSRDEFIKIMDSMDLPYPKKIDESLPANMQCGDQ